MPVREEGDFLTEHTQTKQFRASDGPDGPQFEAADLREENWRKVHSSNVPPDLRWKASSRFSREPRS